MLNLSCYKYRLVQSLLVLCTACLLSYASDASAQSYVEMISETHLNLPGATSVDVRAATGNYMVCEGEHGFDISGFPPPNVPTDQLTVDESLLTGFSNSCIRVGACDSNETLEIYNNVYVSIRFQSDPQLSAYCLDPNDEDPSDGDYECTWRNYSLPSSYDMIISYEPQPLQPGYSEFFGPKTVTLCVDRRCPAMRNISGWCTGFEPCYQRVDDYSRMPLINDPENTDQTCYLPICAEAADYNSAANIFTGEGTDPWCLEPGNASDPSFIERCQNQLTQFGNGGTCGCENCTFRRMTDTSGNNIKPDTSELTFEEALNIQFECTPFSEGLNGDGNTPLICPDDIFEDIDVGSDDPAGELIVLPEGENVDVDEGRICEMEEEEEGDGSLQFPPAVNLRWTAEEPNHLAMLPVPYESAGFGYKHHDLVFSAQTRDIGPPYMEPAVPLPDSVFRFGDSSYCFNADDENCVQSAEIFQPGEDLGVNMDQSVMIGFASFLQGRYNEWKKTQPNPFDPEAYSGEVEELTPRGANITQITEDGDVRSMHAFRFNAALKAASQAFAATRAATVDDPETGGAIDPFVHHPRAQAAIVGPRGCDIGGWYEMMLYQARCIRWFSLNCLCDYEKTFIEGSSEAYVLMKSGMTFETVTPFVKDDSAFDEKRYMVDDPGAAPSDLVPGKRLETSLSILTWPLMWRGNAGPAYGLWRVDDQFNVNAPIEWEGNIGLDMNNYAESSDYDKSYLEFVYSSVYRTARDGTDISGMYPQQRHFVLDQRAGGPRMWDPLNCQISGKKYDPDCPFTGSYDPHDRSQPTRYHYLHDNYEGLEHVAKGDFIIYDETILSHVGSGDMPDSNHPTQGVTDAFADIPDGFVDARYRRHIALVEKVNLSQNGDPISLVVSEWNWGKNLDSCGNTDRWKTLTVRTIYKDRQRYNFDGNPISCSEEPLLCKYGPCDNPDYAECWEPNWYRIKLFRPAFDVAPTTDDGLASETTDGLQRPTCDRFVCLDDNDEQIKCPIIADPERSLRVLCDDNCVPARERDNFASVGLTTGPVVPIPITTDMVKAEFAGRCATVTVSDPNKCLIENWNTADPALQRTVEEFYDLGEWRRGFAGRYDGFRVRHFLNERVGFCEAPIDLREALPESRPVGTAQIICANDDMCEAPYKPIE